MSTDFTPNPTDYTGTYDTSGTAGGAHARIEGVSPVFDIAKALEEGTEVPDVHDPTPWQEEAAEETDADEVPSGALTGGEDPAPNGGPDSTESTGTVDTTDTGAPTPGEQVADQIEDVERVHETGEPLGPVSTDEPTEASGGADATGEDGVTVADTAAGDTAEDAGDSTTSFDPSEKSVAEVLAYIDEHPEEKDSVVAAEREGKGRTTILKY